MLYNKHAFVKIDWLLDQATLILTEKKKKEIKCITKVEVEKHNRIDKILKNFIEVYKIY